MAPLRMRRACSALVLCVLVLLLALGHAPASVRADEPTISYPHSTAPISRGDLLADLELDTHLLALKAMLSCSAYTGVNDATRAAHPDIECEQCVPHFARHLIDSARAALAHTCQTSGLVELSVARCRWMDAHRLETTGYLLARLDAYNRGFAYCVGRGYCKDSSSLVKAVMPDYTRNATLESGAYLHQLASSLPWLERASRESNAREVIDESSHLPVPISESESTRSYSGSPTGYLNVDHLATQEEKCHACLNHGIRWVMRRAIRHMKHQCRTTWDASFKGWCAWVTADEDRRAGVRGIVYAHTQPYNMAIGWCLGKELCAHGTIYENVKSLPFTMHGASQPRPRRYGEARTRVATDGRPKVRQKYYV